MNRLVQAIDFLGGITVLFKNILIELKKKPFYFHIFLFQIYEIGWRSLPIVLVTSASAGMVLTLQFGFTLEPLGGTIYSPKILALSVFREFSPVFTSLVLAGRVGAGMTAEIGAMKVSQQIDALLALGTSPIKRIVIPRFLAGLVAIPMLSLISCLVCILFGALVGYFELNLDVFYFVHKAFVSTKLHDFLSGYIKTYFFAGFIILTACYFGLKVSKGTYEVGNATTKSVVYSSVLIVLGDYIITKIYWMVA